MRIAIAGFLHESNTFTPMKTDRAAFEAQCLKTGNDWVAEWQDAHHEVGGMLEGARAEGAEIVPAVMAWGTPSGPVTADIFHEIVDQIILQVQRSRPDGLLLSLHGAMVMETDPDGDGLVLTRLRQALGDDLPIVVTLDLHGNVSQRLVDQASAIIAYRTCPHVDQRARGIQAAKLLGRMLRGEVRPVMALAKPPVMVNIMVHDTSQPPLATVLAEARQLEEQPGILAVSLLPGFPYADVPQMGPAVVVVADNDPDLARREADRLGAWFWDHRVELTRPLPGPAEAVALALKAEKKPALLIDTGDNVGGGSAADGTILLQELLRQNAADSVVCLFAPDEVQQCLKAGLGAEISLIVGGKVDRLHGNPVEIRGRIRVLHDGTYVETQVRHGGKRLNHMGPTALVEIQNRNLLVLNSLRHPPFSLGQLTCLGIVPQVQSIIVVKAAIAYKAAYLPIAGTIIEVDTPGTTAVNPRRFGYRHVRPMFPLVESPA